jgi:hypothetical protein|nr:MAG TPA: hypothetical protein [Caudoviricetes sp.]
MNDLVRIVKENLPCNVELTQKPYKVSLSKEMVYIHNDVGYVFPIKTVFSDGSPHYEMLFISDKQHSIFHSASSLFGVLVKELDKRCYWVNGKDIFKEVFTV